jgi:3-hydroxyisobutyrate dehydrogenase-like beta-hydroxyacid dehydrogenase
MKRIGFIGLGLMGFPMADNLLKAGYELTVFNRSLEKAESIGSKGAKVAYSPAEVALHSEVIFTMLSTDQAVEEVVFGEVGIINEAAGGKIVIDCSTVSPKTSTKLAQELGKLGVEVLDAPVTGSTPQAIDGVLSFLVGGKKEIFEHCLPLFDVMGKKAYYLGENGAGSYTKLANNSLCAINLLAMAESIVMVTKSGIDPAMFVEIVSNGGGRSGMMENNAPKIINRDFQPNFTAALMHKDLMLATELANQLKIPVPVLSSVKEMFQVAKTRGYGDEDVRSVVKCYEEWAGVEVKRKG